MRFIIFALLILWPFSAPLAAYNKNYIGTEKLYTAKEDDTLIKIARSFELGYVEMRAANPHIDPWLPGKGAELVLPLWNLLPDVTKEGIVINLPEMRLYAFVNDDKAPTTYPLGVGREGLETPIGTTKVIRRKKDPTWRPTARMRREDPDLPEVVPPGPDNPLGSHILYLGWPTYAIHGTDKPYGIGRRISSGCIRLYPENIEQLFKIIPVGTKVTVVNQPIKLAWIDDVLYMEAHPDMDQAIQMEETGQVYAAKIRDEDMKRIIKFAGKDQSKLHWATIRHEIRNRSGRPVMIARREGGKLKDKKLEVIEALPDVDNDHEKDASGNETEISEDLEAASSDIDDKPSSRVHYNP